MAPKTEHPPAQSSPSSSSSTDTDTPDASIDPSSLPQAVKARKTEYTRQQSIRIKVGTWNVAAISGTEEDIGKWFVQRKGVCEEISGLRVSDLQDSGVLKERVLNNEDALPEFAPEKIGLYVLGLQEIVDVSSPAEALRPYVDPAPSNRWKAAAQKALPPGYQLVAETQLVGLLQLIYAAPFLVDQVSSVSCVSVGTGLLGYMGNKGAVATRLMLGETTCLAFVNCHLAAGSDKNSLERRNWDASQIISRAKFDPIDPNIALRDEPTESIGKEDFAFWFGDLNYRLEDIPGDDVRRVLARHTINEYDNGHPFQRDVQDSTASPQIKAAGPTDTNSHPPMVSDETADPHTDPASLLTTISSLLPHDQLLLQQEKKKAFHEGWREGSITFLPTYKYDVGSVGRFDSSEKNRGPSWCDRILYRSRQDKLRYERLAEEAAEARKRDEDMKARGLDKAVADDSVLFDYDPDVDGADSDEYDPDKDSDDEASLDSDPGADESLRLEYYVSHQGILSSDHKPLAAGFTLTLETVDPQLKAKVHQEVVRELDKVENESRPGLTVVVDHHGNQPTSGDPNAVNFGDVPFDVPVTRSLTVANTSGVPATFTLEKPEQDVSNRLPSWLDYRIDPPHRPDSEPDPKQKPSHECTLHPGELANVEITAYVRDIELTRLLNGGQLSLEEILVLRVTNGRDHFISAYGKWLPTCFGRSLEELTIMPEAGARNVTPAKAPADHPTAPGVPLSAPRELFRLTEAISEMTERATAEWSMTRPESEGEDTPPWIKEPFGFGWPFEPETWTLRDKDERSHLLASVREALDTNKDFASIFAPEISSLHRLEILSETLLVFLQSLKDGIVTAAVWQDLDQQLLAREKSKSPPLSWEDAQAWVLESLAFSPAHSVSFTFVTFMLARIANEIAPASSIPARGPSTILSPSSNPSSSSNPPTDSTNTPQKPSDDPPPSSFISGNSLRRRTRTFASSISSSSNSNSTSTGTSAPPPINPMAIRRHAVETALSGVFASVLISPDVPVPSKDKERRALDDRKRSIVEPFLKTIGVDNLGPSGGVS
ncbi:phosphatase family protein [Aspergillus heteromorphus CBS 117.55]|uniref:Phosphatase family protein n=1 Tax=Aspergillus heteromorphus CBS 117.55 TaxID=1448321 RepID=A0A317VEW2_9EURO|nr:phosphatase family protein [Aspergillus heteromorphus CBS 117.55]PWY72904.1 phosphatase family protein [Aspergillus heteromorphus CBS 117.55]